ncbi:MAG: c-type cytochrome [Candidatus Sericytochromatia bacterium]|nr:c-type cytochrome [Candidatus Sericytochromatia bacterium]
MAQVFGVRLGRCLVTLGGLTVAGLLPTLATAADQAPVAFPDLAKRPLPTGPAGAAIRLGRDLVTDTGRWAEGYVGNRLSCGSCHLHAGCQPGAMPLVGMTAVYPMYRSRRAKIDTLEDRINDCFTRSLDGRPLPLQSREMRGLIAYMTWLSAGIPPGKRVLGSGVTLLAGTRPADIGRGQHGFQSTCAACHGSDGLGTPAAPPLWGDRSFTIGAGMARLRTAAGFIQANMPRGQGGSLSEDDAVDIAAYVLSHDRPDFPDKTQDWPQGGKPPDCPY